MKKLLCLFLCIMILTSLVTVASANTDTTKKMTITVDYVNIVLNNQKVWMHNFVHEGTTYIGLRDAGNAFGYEVSWDGTTKTASFKSGAAPKLTTDIPNTEYYVTEIAALVDYANIVIDGIPVQVRNFVYSGTTYVALRDLGTIFDYKVDWDEKSRTASLNKLTLDLENVVGTIDGIEIPEYLIKVEGNSALSSASSIEDVKSAVFEASLIYAFIEKQKDIYDIDLSDEQKNSISKSFDEIVKNEFGGKEILEIVLKQENISYDEYKKYYETVAAYDLIYPALVELITKDKKIVSADKEAALKYYNQNIASFTTPTVRVKHILLPTINTTTGEPLSDKDKAAAKSLASTIYNQLKKTPHNFESYISKYNNDPGMPDAGYLIYKGSGMVIEFEEASLNLSKNQISPIIETSYGYHIIKAIDTYDKIPFEDLYQFNGEDYITNLFANWSSSVKYNFNW